MQTKAFNTLVQKLLNKLGAKPKLVEDGVVGPKTVSALSAHFTTSETPASSAPAKTGKPALWVPWADTSGKAMKGSGEYAKGWPEGLVVHHSAGQCDTEEHAVSMMNYGVEQGYAFFVIGPTGKLYQRIPLNKWGAHAGTSSWPGLGTSLSKKLVGVEVVGAGLVDANGKAWFGKVYPANRLRKVAKKDNIQAGTYVKFTPEQEASLKKLILWLKAENPAVFSLDNVLGHDEIAPSRKNDPGGSLSMTMPEFRKVLKNS